jgi:quinolinate synthase
MIFLDIMLQVGHRKLTVWPSPAFESMAMDLQTAKSAAQRSQVLLQLARSASASLPELRSDANRVMGCTAQVWLSASLDEGGRVQLQADSDAELTRGLAVLLARGLSGLTPKEIEEVNAECLMALGLGDGVLTRSRTNGFLNMLEAAKRRARELQGNKTRFPSIVIRRDGTSARGSFAEAQDAFLHPDPAAVDKLVAVLRAKNIGVVAHFYMDPQVQGVLTSAAEHWPHIKISDSLVMADGAVKMAEAGCTSIAVLGVDFMSENVRAILDEAGLSHIGVFRMDADPIGCSLAEAAESRSYEEYLDEASKTPNSLHVVYINTSLKTKALANSKVPTITCTSSNVVQTVLQTFAQIPESSHVWYGPDTYMGRNLVQLFTSLATASAEGVTAIHREHTPETIAALLPRLHYFEDGTCIVHHLFGGDVCRVVRESYGDAYIAAHFEVPGEMFTLAMEARKRSMGVVGSTQNILDFIALKLGEALERPFPEQLTFVLGTEAGMVTSIVRKVQFMQAAAGRDDVTVEIVFPVSPDAITTNQQDGMSATSTAVTFPGGDSLLVIPGPASGEGCSLEGGCASCPYMKMNSLSALMRVCERVGSPAGEATLEAYKPRPYAELIGGKTIAQAGCVPILHMRSYQLHKRLPDTLVEDILSRH